MEIGSKLRCTARSPHSPSRRSRPGPAVFGLSYFDRWHSSRRLIRSGRTFLFSRRFNSAAGMIPLLAIATSRPKSSGIGISRKRVSTSSNVFPCIVSAFGQPFQQRVPGYDLQQHARNAETEILHGGKEAAREDPFEQRADDLVSQYDGDHRQQRNAFQVTGRHSGGYG